MTRPEITALENELSRAEEAMDLAERLKTTTDDKEFEECVGVLLESPDKLARVLEELKLDELLLLTQAIREQEGAPACDAEPPPAPCRPALPARGWSWTRITMSLLAGTAFVIAPITASMHFLETSEVMPRATGERVKLPDRSFMTTDPYTSGRVNYTFLTRNVELRTGGADFDVEEEWRPFHVNTPLGTATAVGTRFYVRLGGSADNLEAFVRVRLGTVRFDLPANSPEMQKTWTFAANKEFRVTSKGGGQVTDLSDVGRPASGLAEFTGAPLAQLAAAYRLRGQGPRIVIEGSACRHSVSGSFDLDDPRSLIDYVLLAPELKASLDKDVVVVRAVADTSLAQGAAQNGCGVDLHDDPAATSANRRP